MILRLRFNWAVDRKTAMVSSLYRGEVLPSEGEAVFEFSPTDSAWPKARAIAISLAFAQVSFYISCREQLIVIHAARTTTVSAWLYQKLLDQETTLVVLEALVRAWGIRVRNSRSEGLDADQ